MVKYILFAKKYKKQHDNRQCSRKASLISGDNTAVVLDLSGETFHDNSNTATNSNTSTSSSTISTTRTDISCQKKGQH
jgi:hypothetical protein